MYWAEKRRIFLDNLRLYKQKFFDKYITNKKNNYKKQTKTSQTMAQFSIGEQIAQN